MRVGVDIDGVLYDFFASFRRYWVKSHTRSEHERNRINRVTVNSDGEPTFWEFYKEMGLTLDEFKNHWENGIRLGIIYRGPAREGAQLAVSRLMAAGHTVCLVTDRGGILPELAESLTRLWLEDNAIPFDTLALLADKTSVGVDVFIEDKIENYEALWADGTPCILVNRPWNQHPWGHEDDGRYRVDSVTEAVDKILAGWPATFWDSDDTRRVAPVDLAAEVRSVSATGGEKGTKLARYDLLPAKPLHELAEHYGRGALKYDDDNWRRGYEWSKSFAALQRHAWAFWDGEDIDAETGSKHLIAVAWHALALAEFMDAHPDYDNRRKP